VIWAWRAYPGGGLVRRSAALALLFTITEALVGAGLVLFRLVEGNDSAARAFWIAVHLANTFLLLAAITLTAVWASGRPARLPTGHGRSLGTRRGLVWALGAAFLGTLLVGMSGAVTALGDTLFPSGSLAEGVRSDFAPTAHFLLRLRVLHPILAVGVGLYLVVLASSLRSRRPDQATVRRAGVLIGVVTLQLGAGMLNLVLQAPIVMQMVHLLLADLVWIALVILAAWILSPVPAGNAVTRLAEPQGLAREGA
jgi:heme A synthase